MAETWYGNQEQIISVQQHLQPFHPSAVVRDKFDGRSADSYYLCTIVLFDVSKNSDLIHSRELSSDDMINQCPKGEGNEEVKRQCGE